MELSDIYHIIVAAGSGSRFGAELPKQFCDMAGRPVLMETIARFRRYGQGGHLILVLSADMLPLWDSLCRKHGFMSPPVIFGGATRWESVRNAIAAVPPRARVITVHDGARPLVGAGVIRNVLSAVSSGCCQGALPAVAVTDSVRCIATDGSSRAVDRSRLRAVQTPQAFDAALLRRAYTMPYQSSFTDDASVMEAAGFGDIALVEGSPVNIKITHPADIKVAELYLSV